MGKKVLSVIPLVAVLMACSNAGHDKVAISSDAMVQKARMMNLAKVNGCFQCHAFDTDVEGPSWNHVAARYHNSANAKDKLISSVKFGSQEKWGDNRMPPQEDRVAEGDIEQIVDFILALNDQ